MLRIWIQLFCIVWWIGECGTVAAGTMRVFFSPKGGCTAAVVEALRKATNSVYVQAYSFTSAPIAQALVEASRRKVQVSVLLDKSQRSEKYSSADFLKNSGISTFIDATHAIAHNKVMIIDTNVVITGSFNFTKAAEENNAENMLVVEEPQLAKIYLTNWKTHQLHSAPYSGRGEPKRTPKTSQTGKRQTARGASAR